MWVIPALLSFCTLLCFKVPKKMSQFETQKEHFALVVIVNLSFILCISLYSYDVRRAWYFVFFLYFVWNVKAAAVPATLTPHDNGWGKWQGWQGRGQGGEGVGTRCCADPTTATLESCVCKCQLARLQIGPKWQLMLGQLTLREAVHKKSGNH